MYFLDIFNWWFSGWISVKLALIWSNRHLQHDSLLFLPLASRFTTFWLGRVQKHRFLLTWPCHYSCQVFKSNVLNVHVKTLHSAWMVFTALMPCRWPFSLMASFSEETDPQKLMQRTTVYLIHQAFLHWQDYAAMEIVSDKKTDFTCSCKEKSSAYHSHL